MIEARQNPDWYRIKYSLAAESFNWVYEVAGDRAELGGEGNDPEIPDPEDETRKLLSLIEQRLHVAGRRSWRRRSDDDRRLDEFLCDLLKPGTLVLLAGIELFKHGGQGERSMGEGEESSLVGLERRIDESKPIDPYALAARVEAQRKSVPASVSFNLACFYSQAGQVADVRRCLANCAEGTPPSEWPRLLWEIESDPFVKGWAEWAGASGFGTQFPPARKFD